MRLNTQETLMNHTTMPGGESGNAAAAADDARQSGRKEKEKVKTPRPPTGNAQSTNLEHRNSQLSGGCAAEADS